MKSLGPFFDNVNKLIAGFTFFIIFYGYLDLAGYYTSFNIDIYQYIGVSEIIISSVKNLPYLVISFSIQIFSIILILFNLEDYCDYHYEKRKLISWLKRKKTFFFLGILCLIVLFSFWLSRIYPTNFYVVGAFHFILINSITLIISIIICLGKFILHYNKKEEENNSSEHSNYTIERMVIYTILYTMLIFISFKSYFKNIETKNFKNDNKVTIYFSNNDKININDSIKYLGKTENYYFIWNNITNTSTVYPAGEIMKIEIGKK